MEIFGLPCGHRPDFYVSVREWWEAIAPSRVLLVLTTTIFAYYSGTILGKHLPCNLV